MLLTVGKACVVLTCKSQVSASQGAATYTVAFPHTYLVEDEARTVPQEAGDVDEL